MTRLPDEGQVGGIEGVLFGLLVFVLGTLLVANAWTVVDAKVAASAAAREAARAYVEADSPKEAVDEATKTAGEAIEAHGRRRDRTDVAVVEGSFTRCARVVVEVRYRVPLAAVPVVGTGAALLTVSARHAEIVDPYRSGPAGAAQCANA
jgi:hypothetical protein